MIHGEAVGLLITVAVIFPKTVIENNSQLIKNIMESVLRIS